MLSLNQFISKVKDYDGSLNLKRIEKAYEFGKLAHDGQKRMSGEPYFMHPIAVALKLIDLGPDEDMIIAALLHDVSEDTDFTLDDIEERFGPNVRNLVCGLEKVAKVKSRLNEPNVENLRKMFVSMASDLRVIVIKLCDRWHNMSTLDHVAEHKQVRIAKETLDVYIPIASRLGIYKIKGEMEDTCFKYLYPDMYGEIDAQLTAYSKSNVALVRSVKASLKKYLQGKGYTFDISSRVKNRYSIYKKLKKKGKGHIEDIYDIFAIRIVLPTELSKKGEEDVSSLYQVLGYIHNRWTPLPNRFKDYVAVAKPNGYRSLHTTVIGLGPKGYNKPIEVQIRNEVMHEEAECGVAAHWAYKSTGGSEAKLEAQSEVSDSFMDSIKKTFRIKKSGGKELAKLPKKSVLDSQVAWVKALEELQRNTPDGGELIENLQSDVFNDRIFVLTPKGQAMDLPLGSTPVDFAYSVHTDVGHKCIMAKVNGNVVPLDFQLKNGQVVSIITKEGAKPNQYWLSFVKTSGAKTKIKAFFKSIDAEKNVKQGREILNSYFEKIGKDPLDNDLSILKKYGDKDLTLKQREKLLEEVGAGVVIPSVVVKNVFGSELNKKPRKKKAKKTTSESLGVREIDVDGIDNVPVRFATCCAPMPGQGIIGFVTRGNGISVHRKDCKVMLNDLKDRTIPVKWKGEAVEEEQFRVTLSVEILDRKGLLHDVSEIMDEEGANIGDISLGRNSGKIVKMRFFDIELPDQKKLDRLVKRLCKVRNVLAVRVV